MGNDNLAIRTYGRRLYDEQTLPEYLLEFALIFMAEKESQPVDSTGQGRFHMHPSADSKLGYTTKPRVGLKRFIFFDRSKQDGRHHIDTLAYREMRALIEDNVTSDSYELTATDAVNMIQELLYGYNVVLLNRSWFAQSLLPICPELMFPEAMRAGKPRARLGPNDIEIKGNSKVDNDFTFTGYYFLARGGEVYYRHVLQGLASRPDLQQGIEEGLNDLFTARKELAALANWIQTTWENHMDVENRSIKMACDKLPEGYAERAKYTCEELHNFLTAHVDRFRKIELLALGIGLQILRMMHERAASLTKSVGPNLRPSWIVHIPGCKNTDVRGLAVRSYQHCEDDLLGALYTQKPKDTEIPLDFDLQKEITAASRHANRLFRRRGKDIGLVIPPSGRYTRFSLTEDILTFLVMSLIPPGSKVLLSEFLASLYEHFGIIIGPAELKRSQEELNADQQAPEDVAVLRSNENALRDMLKACGYLRDLSDATAIVENPFGGGN